MNKEIGGYLGLEQFINNEYYKDLIALNTGRNALLYLFKAKAKKKAYIPYYLCNSVREVLTDNGYAFECYHVDTEFNPIFDKEVKKDEVLYVVNYYGQLTDGKIRSLKNRFREIVLDNTQSFFQKPLKGIDTIYSCRKFFGVSDGAYLATDRFFNEVLEIDISKDRMRHILGRYEEDAPTYYDDYLGSEAIFKTETLKKMSKLTHNILGVIDYRKVKHIRNENYIFLENRIGTFNKLNLKIINGPFAYPFYTEKGIEIRKKLAKKKIYIPILWPNVLNNLPEDSIEYQYVAHILPLPCDQRYGFEDMEYIAEEILKCIN